MVSVDSFIEGPNMRFTTVFSDAGNTTTGKWEHSRDDSNWQTFWDAKATKTLP